ncbi:phage tail protein [Dyella sp. M7H15-1]|uniref:phage tail sheath C-terminal domain-containing protein n=1 Tax=Dyella sp. M7H15-1 TaxID=2501295 RepID=UPI001004E96E|nr:phage tail sheath C-terminal domain-containing protein [Dyella sp. M7H15-1]QAU22892.1 phage tail protein [Dyella sp. M7H15-1]
MAVDQFLHGVEVVDVDDGVRTISTASSSVIGIVGTAPWADPAVFPLNTPVLVAGSEAKLAALVANPEAGASRGSLPYQCAKLYDQAKAVLVVVRVADAGEWDDTVRNVAGGAGMFGQFSGVYALLLAQSVTGVKPRILIAPGWTAPAFGVPGMPMLNEVVSALQVVAGRLRAVYVHDGPNTTDEDALKLAQLAAHHRGYMVESVGLNGRDGEPAWGSTLAAGVMAATDNNLGWWHSPSNKIVSGITEISRPVAFAMGDTACSANVLNAGNVTCLIQQDGFRLWGNRVTGAQADPKWKYLCVVRTADIIADSLQAAHLWAVDRGITKNYVTDVQEGVNAFLRRLKSLGAIVGGMCWYDAALNTPESIADGNFYWDFDFTPTYPGEHLTFRSHLVNNYLTEIV